MMLDTILHIDTFIIICQIYSKITNVADTEH